MLFTTITYDELVSQPVILSPFIRKIRENHKQIYLPSADKAIADIYFSQNMITINYSSELFLNEFMIIHEVISQLKAENHNISIDDSNSFLGYLPNGDSAYILTNWEEWLRYIQQSMKYCQ